MVERAGIRVVPIGPIDPAYPDYLAFALPDAVGMPVEVRANPVGVDDAYDPVRRQWNAATILSAVSSLEPERAASRIVGVADLDLFIPILTFVFGLAHLGARAALVSLHRLRPEFYGLPADPDLLLNRLEKEALHELGHTGGLRHCPDYFCVMHYSNTVDEVDLKAGRYCPRCAGRLAMR